MEFDVILKFGTTVLLLYHLCFFYIQFYSSTNQGLGGLLENNRQVS